MEMSQDYFCFPQGASNVGEEKHIKAALHVLHRAIPTQTADVRVHFGAFPLQDFLPYFHLHFSCDVRFHCEPTSGSKMSCLPFMCMSTHSQILPVHTKTVSHCGLLQCTDIMLMAVPANKQ